MQLNMQIEIDRTFAGNSVMGALVKKLIESGTAIENLTKEIPEVSLTIVFPVDQIKYMTSAMVEAVFADIADLRTKVKLLSLRLPQS